MKVRHKDLEVFRADPRAFAAAGAKKAFMSPSMYRCWHLALRVYHSVGRAAAVTRLSKDLTGRFKKTAQNERKAAGWEDALNAYADSFEALGHTAVLVQKTVNIDISPKLSIGGEIARLDMIDIGGYAVYLFLRESIAWEDELRFPVLQAHFAKEMNCPLDEIQCGVYRVEDGEHEARSFAADVPSAMREMARLAAKLP